MDERRGQERKGEGKRGLERIGRGDESRGEQREERKEMFTHTHTHTDEGSIALINSQNLCITQTFPQLLVHSWG